ncbi:MAG: hypothetical protein A2V66_00470 [Ignavibacteria bacterium RBG_13_36_8]|nr:MAG: hypothetical protein A2V66_00470 [Ignavibacteria bacterium RBG_13_36_8]
MNDRKKLNIDYTVYETFLTKKFVNRKMYAPADPKKITAFIPGSIREIYVRKGQKVKEGDPLFILEAMKMRNSVYSPLNGKIKEVHMVSEQKVAKNQLLIEFE